MSSSARIRIGAGLLALLMLSVACSGASSDPTPTSVAPPSPRPSSSAKLTIVTPKNGEVIHGSNVAVKVDLTGAKIVSTTSTDLQPDQGHLHLILDDTLVSMTSGTETVIPDVTPGNHLLEVEFVANDHAPFNPRVIQAVTFEVKG